MMSLSFNLIVLLCLITTGLYSYAFVQTLHLHLPLPLAIPICALAIALLTTLGPAIPGTRNRLTHLITTSRKSNSSLALLGLTTALLLLAPTFLTALSASPLFSDALLTCHASTYWSTLFQHKDAATVRAIQNALRCCGFNSPHDRAWPFPSAHEGTDARTCERTTRFGDRSCGRSLEGQLRSAAVAEVVAGVVLQVLVLSVVYALIVGDRYGDRPWASDRDGSRRPLLGSPERDDVARVLREDERRAGSAQSIGGRHDD